MRHHRLTSSKLAIAAAATLWCYQASITYASTVSGEVVGEDEEGGTETWEWTVTAGEGELIRDFHVCIGKKKSGDVLGDVIGDVEFPEKPTNWDSSVTALDQVHVYINFYAGTGGVSIGESDGEVKFQATVEKEDVETGKVTATFTTDGNEDAADGKIPETDDNKNPKPIDGPVLSVASGSCNVEPGVCYVSTAESCALLEGVFDLNPGGIGGFCAQTVPLLSTRAYLVLALLLMIMGGVSIVTFKCE